MLQVTDVQSQAATVSAHVFHTADTAYWSVSAVEFRPVLVVLDGWHAAPEIRVSDLPNDLLLRLAQAHPAPDEWWDDTDDPFTGD